MTEGSNVPEEDRPRVLVLAGRRGGALDPLAAAAGVTHKCLLPVAGEAMIGRVLRIAHLALPDSRLFVSIEDFAVIASEPNVARLHAAGQLTPVIAHDNIFESVVSASQISGFPLIVTTADNVLITVNGMKDLSAEGAKWEADAIVVMAEKVDIVAAHPDGQRRFYRLRDGSFSNCNLFWLGNGRSLRAAETFRFGGQFVKNKARAARALGLAALFLYATKAVTLAGLFRHFSHRFGIRMKAMVVRDGCLAIDVDNERTRLVAEEILGRNTAQP